MAIVKFTNPETKKPDSFYMENRLFENIQKIKKNLNNKDEDYVCVVDGREGSGKSVFAMQLGCAVDSHLNLSRITMNAEQFKNAIFNAKKGQAVIFDEAFTGLSSRSSMSEVNRLIVSMMMMMRQKNLFVIIVLPSFFMLDKYCALFRSRSLIHIHKKKDRRRFMVFNHKKKMQVYLTGKQTYSFGKNRTSFNGRFYGKYIINEDEYREKKAKALVEMENQPEHNKYVEQRDGIIYILKNETKYTDKKVAELFDKYEIGLKQSAINTILQKNIVKHGKITKTKNNL